MKKNTVKSSILKFLVSPFSFLYFSKNHPLMRRRRNIRTANRGFLMGIAALAIMVMLIVGLFLYWCMPVPVQ
ncbi:MAG: hypothetical protein IK084_01075 [Bacteroidaceae bacterium]|nr:hypothetical protein [Bacteroidaceae bacterium]